MDAPPDSVAVLYQGLHGLKKACRLFNKHIDAALGFVPSTSDPSLYIANQGGIYAVCALVVDDLLLAMDSLSFSAHFQNALAKTYNLSVLGEPTWTIVFAYVSAADQQADILTKKLTLCRLPRPARHSGTRDSPACTQDTLVAHIVGVLDYNAVWHD